MRCNPANYVLGWWEAMTWETKFSQVIVSSARVHWNTWMVVHLPVIELLLSGVLRQNLVNVVRIPR